MAFYYPEESWSSLKNVPWGGKYVFDDDIIRYISIENRKTNFPVTNETKNDLKINGNIEESVVSVNGENGNKNNENNNGNVKENNNKENKNKNDSNIGPSILVHTSVPFGIEYKDADETVVYNMIKDHLNMVLPNLGKYN